MLQVFLNDTKVDLSPDTAISLMWENSFFSPDSIVAPYSLTWSIPDSRRNLAVIGHADRTVSGAPTAKLRCRILFCGIELWRGMAAVDGIGEDSIDLSCTSIDILDKASGWLHELDFGRVSFGKATEWHNSRLDVYSWQTHDAWKNYSAYWQARTAEPLPDVFAPTMAVHDAKWIPFDLSERPSYWSANKRASRVNAYNAAGYGAYNVDYSRILPAFRLAWILSKIHPAIGSHFASSSMGRMVMCSTYHPSYHPDGINSSTWTLDKTTGDVYLDPRDCMPKVNVGDFLCDCLQSVCASLYIIRGEVFVTSRSEILSSTTDALDLTGRVVGAVKVSFEKAQRYALSYSSLDSDESIESEREISRVASLTAMVSSSTEANAAPTTFKTFEISDTGQTFQMQAFPQLSTDSRTFIDHKLIGGNMNFTSAEDESDAFDVQLSLKPLRMVLAVDMKTDAQMVPSFDILGRPLHNYVYCPEFEPAQKERPTDVYVGVYHGMSPAIGYGPAFNYPFVSSDNRDAYGRRAAGRFSWEIGGSDGLLTRYHEPFARWIGRDRRAMELEATLTPLELHNMDLRRKIFYDGRRFIARSVSVVLRCTSIDPAVIDMVAD